MLAPMPFLRYAHTLVFACPECNLPVSTTRVSHEQDSQSIDKQKLNLWCPYCHSSSDLLAGAAKRHYVGEWPSAMTRSVGAS
jgi:Zn finger protein HypA/HybF involved in hydrogenase expression